MPRGSVGKEPCNITCPGEEEALQYNMPRGSGIALIFLFVAVRFGNKVLRSDSIAILRDRRKKEPIESE